MVAPKLNGGAIHKLPTTPQTNQNQPATLQLSRPLNQIIEDTFREEFANTYGNYHNLRQRTSRKLQQQQKPPQSTPLQKQLSITHIKTKTKRQTSIETISEEVVTPKKDPKDLQSDISNTHKEIVKTLTQILSRSEELRKTLMGGQMQDVRKDKGPVRVLNLSLGQHQDSVIYRIKRNTSLQFRLGPNLFGKRGKLFFNYPVGIRLFKRDEYQDLEWRLDDNCKNSDDTAYYAKLKLTLPGGYHYYLEDRSDKSILASGYVLVDPELSFGPNEPLPLDCIQCQTVLAKSLGHFNTWPGKLLVAKEAGYNMIHFTPIQELGDSNSSYSLRDQLKLNPQFNDKHHVTKEELSDFIEKLRSEWKMLSICDIVLNHTANESPWLVDHPEATYNCLNCPYLRPAYLLDAALYQFSRDVRDGVYETSGIPKEISTEDHLNVSGFKKVFFNILTKIILGCEALSSNRGFKKTKASRVDYL